VEVVQPEQSILIGEEEDISKLLMDGDGKI
jgi:hypothetical protein